MLAYLQYDEAHPHGAWAAYMGMGRSDPVLRGIEDIDNDRQANRIIDRVIGAIGDALDPKVERDLRATVYGWLAFTFEMCRQRLIDSSMNADYVADVCAHTLLDAIGRVPGIPAVLADAVASDSAKESGLDPEVIRSGPGSPLTVGGSPGARPSPAGWHPR